MKKTIILAIVISLASATFAERRSIRDRSENWLQNNASETSGGLRADGDPGWINSGTDSNDPIVTQPVGGGLAFLVLSGLGYALVARRKK
ncbi:MAG: hypothetical protein LBS25_01360 [Candidatus Symbiothrix sp.]|nr:hypothetical protein [Candidatus Symbiothrix sp.]